MSLCIQIFCKNVQCFMRIPILIRLYNPWLKSIHIICLMSAMRTLFRKSINWESPRCLIISVNSNILKIFHRDSKFCQSFYNLHLLVSLLLMVIEKNHHLQWLLYLKMVHWWQKFHFIFSFNLRWTKHSKSLDTIGILLIVITFKSENLFLKLDFILSFGGSKVFPKVTDWYI